MKKKTNNGYKGMLRDRIPKTVNLALKWCKAKNKWIDHVYYHHIWWCKEKQYRDAQTRAILGLGKYGKSFDFNSSIDWDKLDKDKTEYWTKVSSWVKWFEENHQQMENIYDIYTKTGKPEMVKPKIMENIKLDDEWKEKLTNYIIKNIQNEYLCIFQTLI